jgi:hypothetical protein
VISRAAAHGRGNTRRLPVGKPDEIYSALLPLHGSWVVHRCATIPLIAVSQWYTSDCSSPVLEGQSPYCYSGKATGRRIMSQTHACLKNHVIAPVMR